MTTTVHAVFENGVFRPVEPIALPERTSVELEVRVPSEQRSESPMPEGLVFHSWIVAAAILARGWEKELYYWELADRVVATGLTTLGLKSSTPQQTLGGVLRQHSNTFVQRPWRRGYYSLRKPEDTLMEPPVAMAVKALEEIERERKAAGEVASSLQRDVQQLKERNAMLERKIAEIAEICTPLLDAEQDVDTRISAHLYGGQETI